MKNKDLINKLESVRALVDEYLIEARGAEAMQKSQNAARGKRERVPNGHIDFGVPIRPFMKQYSKGMSGPKKFTLLLARLTQGDLKRQVLLADLKKQWNRMKRILIIKFNRYYSAIAVDNGWVECKKVGYYNLRSTWRNILS